MNWVEVITQALEYIEKNLLSNELSAENVAKNVNISYGHFSRAFCILTQFSVSEYIRNRRLSLAGNLLKNTDKSVLDIALDIGYETPEAFTKAFKRFHNVSPNKCKDVQLRNFPPLQLKLTLIQEDPISPIIEYKGELILNGNIEFISDNEYAAKLWEDAYNYGYISDLYNDKGFNYLAGVYYKDTYTIKALCSSKTSQSVVIPPHKWAVFNCIGEYPDSIDITWDKIYSAWLSSHNVKLSNLPQIEVYKGDELSYSCEIWIPIE